MTIRLGFAMSTTAYLIQELSDILSVDSIVKSTRLARLASIRHFRASTILGDKNFSKIQVNIPNELELKRGRDDLDKIYLQLKNIDIAITKALANIKNVLEFKLIKRSHIKTIMFTHKYIRDVKLKNFKNTNFLDKFICFQCGEIYTKGIDNIDCCNFCGSGFNLIEKVYTIM